MIPSINAADLIASHADTLVEDFEGDILKVYKDGNGVWTIGYGHTGPDINAQTQPETQEQAIQDLKEDILTADNDILNNVKVPLNQNQFDALVSFDYNIGEGHLKRSTTLDKLNLGEYQTAADAMLMWDIINGAPSTGLMRRRKAERALFLTPVTA